MGFLLIATGFQPVTDQLELPLFLGVSHNRVGDRATQPVGHDGGGAVAFEGGGFAGFRAIEPWEDIAIQEAAYDITDFREIPIEGCRSHPGGEFSRLHGADQGFAGV